MPVICAAWERGLGEVHFHRHKRSRDIKEGTDLQLPDWALVQLLLVAPVARSLMPVHGTEGVLLVFRENRGLIVPSGSQPSCDTILIMTCYSVTLGTMDRSPLYATLYTKSRSGHIPGGGSRPVTPNHSSLKDVGE